MKQVSAIIISTCDEAKMNSKKSKYTHAICGKPLIQWTMDAVVGADIENISLILGQNHKQVLKCLNNNVKYIIWPEKFITEKDGHILVLRGDMPLISSETINKIVENHINNENVLTIVKTTFENSGIYCFTKKFLFEATEEIDDKAMPEQKILSAVEKLCKKGLKIGIINIDDEKELLRVDDRIQLNVAETFIRKQIANRHMTNGVTVINPEAAYIDYSVKIGRDTTILPGTILEGNTVIGDDCLIGPNSRIINSTVNDAVEINSSEVIESFIDKNSIIGPFAYIRPNSRIGKDVKIGDYVEVKNSTIGDNTKVSHLTYVGDASIGEDVNIGCGVVFVNFNGKAKNRAVIGNNAFIGCNVNIISPVTVKENAYIAAGSTITDDVPENALAIARQRQIIKENWATKKDK
ncbi:MAG: DapH/DapD/GlmU-related protein [Clostridia bacterium]|jgi:bifunctional UDP-N-acetylglucosamine pyrophosphorylase/glucosamine-1-phosphate N-acetyltransferase